MGGFFADVFGVDEETEEEVIQAEKEEEEEAEESEEQRDAEQKRSVQCFQHWKPYDFSGGGMRGKA